MGKLSRAIISGIITGPLHKAVGASDPSGRPGSGCWQLSWKRGIAQGDLVIVTHLGMWSPVPASLPLATFLPRGQGGFLPSPPPGAVAGAVPPSHIPLQEEIRIPSGAGVSNALPDYQQAPGRAPLPFPSLPQQQIKREGERRSGGCSQPRPAASSSLCPTAPPDLS